jgi:hypothetical protein
MAVKGSRMAHFFFSVQGSGPGSETVDLDLPTLERAHIEARDSARDMLVDGALRGEDRQAWQMIVTDEAGDTVLQMPLAAAFRTH